MAQKEQQPTVYSDKVSMASGNGNGDNLTPITMPSIVDEVSDALIPQVLAQFAPPLFEDRCIFVHAAQYHQHPIEGDMEARECLIALVQQLYKFGNRTKAKEAEI